MGFLFAQSDVDAIRFSQTYLGGTAKTMGMAGSFGALGADASSSTYNPAGLGVYKRTEYALSPSLSFVSAEANYKGTTKSESDEKFAFTNLSMVITKETSGKTLTNWSFSFGMNKTADYTGYRLIQGNNNKNSLLDEYVNYADKVDVENFEDYPDLDLPWQTYLLNWNSTNQKYYSAIPSGTDILQREIKETSGYQREMYFATGLNFKDKIYTGISIGIPSIHYNSTTNYKEIDNQNVLPYFNNYRLTEELSVEGSGVNVKIGVIAKPMDWLRVGASLHSPTWYSMNDSWENSMSSDIDTATYYDSYTGNFNYQLKTPWKASGSMGFVFGKLGLVNVDVDFLDYTSTRFRSSDYDFIAENDAIHNKYKSAFNYRVGGEYNLGVVVLRAGYAHYGSPFKDQKNDGSKSFITGGIGFRAKHFFSDIAYVHATKKEDYYLYPSTSAAIITNKSDQFVVTIGMRF